MNFKKILCLTLAFVMALAVCASAKTLEFTMGANTMYESADKINSYTLENAPYTKNDRTMVPARIISERFGADVEWNPDTCEVTIKKDDKTIVLTLGKQEAYVNGEVVVLDVAPEEFNGRTMIPLRFVSEILGMDVDYIMATQQVIISDEEPIMTVNGIKITADDYKSVVAYLGYDPANDDAKELMDYVNTAFKEIYATSTYLKDTGFVYSGEYGKDVASSIEQNAEKIYKKALTAPISKLLENDLYSAEVVTKYTESGEALDEIQKIYDKEYVTAKHILILSEDRSDLDAKKLAESVLKKIKNGDDFDSLMTEYCEDPGVTSNPDGYTFTTGEMVEEFEKAAFALEVGEISGVVKSSYGYHIIKREPLAQIDYYNAYAITERVAEEYYNSLVELALEKSEIIINKTDDEIIKLFQ